MTFQNRWIDQTHCKLNTLDYFSFINDKHPSHRTSQIFSLFILLLAISVSVHLFLVKSTLFDAEQQYTNFNHPNLQRHGFNYSTNMQQDWFKFSIFNSYNKLNPFSNSIPAIGKGTKKINP